MKVFWLRRLLENMPEDAEILIGRLGEDFVELSDLRMFGALGIPNGQRNGRNAYQVFTDEFIQSGYADEEDTEAAKHGKRALVILKDENVVAHRKHR
jgi:hypothetical protein